jgi:glycosyltransferase involved in cell wall biosynthesis
MPPSLSFVIPFLDEASTLRELFEAIRAQVLRSLGPDAVFEVIFVDDGSRDGSVAVVEKLCAEYPEARLVQLRGNFGKSAALAAGFDHALHDVIFTMDADLQDDPREIPRFLAMIDEGYDLVSGYKRKRNDPVTKVVPSRVFNALVRGLTGIALHDVNCGFKCYRAEVLRNIRLYGELHRFIPVLAHWKRFRIGELVVEHHPRRFGKSKFGGGRFFRGLMDLLTVYFLSRYGRKPSHFFGAVGGLSTLAGLLICGYLSVLWFGGESIGHRPLLILGVLLIVVGVQTVTTGLVAEMLVQFTSPAQPYVVRRTLQGGARTTVAPVSIPRGA